MSSSQPFVMSSSPNAAGVRRRSKFTYKHLSLLSQSSTACPLRIVTLLDLDCFYAQCEAVRLGVKEDQPLAVQQWSGLIALNYAARAFGLSRHVTVEEAKKLCPNLIAQHVATWREGDSQWAYRDDAYHHIGTDKVSLDPYRLQSRRILSLIKDKLPAPPLQRVEKASIDEVFLDLSAQIHSILLNRYPELQLPPPYDDPTENLPMPPSTTLDWQADALVDLDKTESEEDEPDWDDHVMLIGSEIVRDLRKAIQDELKYTCSAGIAKNKFLAKLASAYKKPNQQTIVRNRAVQKFLSGFKFTKIRNLGGKLGDHVVSTFGTDDLVELLQYSLEQLKSKLGDETGSWLYGIVRGDDTSEVNSRTQIKSMLSAKSFRPSINTSEQAIRWLRIFVADIYSRLVEEGVVENKRRPKTMNLHHRQGGTTKSRQTPIPSGKKIDENMLFGLAKTLLGQILGEGKAWPCANLSLSVGGFEDGLTGNRGISSFLVHGDEAKALSTTNDTNDAPSEASGPAGKRRKVVGDADIQHFFSKNESAGEHDEHFGAYTPPVHDDHHAERENTDAAVQEKRAESPSMKNAGTAPDVDSSGATPQKQITSHICQACKKPILEENREEHQDWHFAKDLQADEQDAQPTAASRPSSHSHSAHQKKRNQTSARVSRKQHAEKGQQRLAFG